MSRAQLKDLSARDATADPNEAGVPSAGGQPQVAEPPTAPAEQGSGGGPATAPPLAAGATASPTAPAASPQPVAGVAGIGTRFVAYLIDAGLALGVIIVWALVGRVVSSIALNISSGLYSFVEVVTSLGAMLVAFGIWAVYAIAVGRLGQTVGKRVMGVRVVDVRTGAPIGVGRAFVRWLVFWLMGLPCYLGYISYFTDGTGRNRAFHDKAADDVVATVQGVPFVQSVKDVLRSVQGG